MIYGKSVSSLGPNSIPSDLRLNHCWFIQALLVGISPWNVLQMLRLIIPSLWSSLSPPCSPLIWAEYCPSCVKFYCAFSFLLLASGYLWWLAGTLLTQQLWAVLSNSIWFSCLNSPVESFGRDLVARFFHFPVSFQHFVFLSFWSFYVLVPFRNLIFIPLWPCLDIWKEL